MSEQKYVYLIVRSHADEEWNHHTNVSAYSNHERAAEEIAKLRAANRHLRSVVEMITNAWYQYQEEDIGPRPYLDRPPRPKGPSVHNEALLAEFRAKKAVWDAEIEVIQAQQDVIDREWQARYTAEFQALLDRLGIAIEDRVKLGITPNSQYVRYVPDFKYTIEAVLLDG